MTQTTNYQLPQWEATDPVRREDFNAAMAGIEVGITAAQETADAAQAAAEQLSYVTGSYTGAGAEKTVNLGFRPSYLIIGSIRGSSNAGSTGISD